MLGHTLAVRYVAGLRCLVRLCSAKRLRHLFLIDHLSDIADAIDRHVGKEEAALVRSAFGFGDAEQLRQSVVDAGFRDVEIRVEAETIRHASLEEYVPGYISATPVAGAVADLNAAVQGEIVADVRGALGAYRVGDGMAAPIEAHLAIGYR